MCSPIWRCYIQTATDNFTQRSEKAPLASFVKSDAFWLLEPNAGKLARSVLRGGGSREATSLPSSRRGFDSRHPLQIYRVGVQTSTISKSSLRAPHSGHAQFGGTSSHLVPGGMPSSGEPLASS